LLNEARLASMVTHAHFARIYDAFERGDETFIVMEYVEGESLRQRLARGPMRDEEFRRVAGQTASAVLAAHEAGIIHGDLKPDNVMLEASSGSVKVCDFGIARRVAAVSSSDTTKTGVANSAPLSGTPGYMAPEVLLGERGTPASDVFALGVMWCEMLTGEQPFAAASVIATANRVLNEPLVDLAALGVPVALADLIARMADKSAANRPAARDVVAVITAPRGTAAFTSGVAAETSAHSGTTALPALPPLPATSAPARRPWVLVASVGALVLLAVVGGLVYRSGSHEAASNRSGQGLSSGAEFRNLVILPFDVVGEEPISEGLATGLTETVNAHMTQFTAGSRLQVIAPRLSTRVAEMTVADARADLGAHIVLTGTIQRSGSRLRVNMVLTDAASSRQLGGDTLTVAGDDTFALQDQVVRGVARLLAVEPVGSTATTDPGTGNRLAFDRYLQGRGYLRDYDKLERVEQAVALFEQALGFDANFALAYAGLGEAYWRQFELTRATAWVDRSRQACERAAAIDSRRPEADACLAVVLSGTGRNEEAAVAFERAVKADGTNEVWVSQLAATYERLGRPGDAEATHKRAIALRPNAWTVYNELGSYYFRQREYAEATAMFSKVVTLAPASFRGHANLGAAYFAQHDLDQAVASFERSMAIRPNYQAASNLGTASFARHDYGRAVIAFERAVQLNERESRVWLYLGSAHLWNGAAWPSQQAFTKACELLQDLYRVNASDPQVLVGLGECSAALGDSAKARGYLEKAVAAAPESSSLLLRAAVVEEFFLGRRPQALELLRRARGAGLSDAEIAQTQALEGLRSALDPRSR
jgi:serine/threonine-protein kinase